uniref:Homeobox domain-containing protein n=1 Tax=Macrostomum lignano TaxID=282301 RepID=A0A1I8F633_9PLAT
MNELEDDDGAGCWTKKRNAVTAMSGQLVATVKNSGGDVADGEAKPTRRRGQATPDFLYQLSALENVFEAHALSDAFLREISPQHPAHEGRASRSGSRTGGPVRAGLNGGSSTRTKGGPGSCCRKAALQSPISRG